MFCSKCAAQLPDDANFCFKCSAPVSVDFTSQTAHARRVETFDERKNRLQNEVENYQSQQKVDSRPSKNNDFLKFAGIAASALVIVFLIVGGVFLATVALQKYEEDRNRTQNNHPASNSYVPESNNYDDSGKINTSLPKQEPKRTRTLKPTPEPIPEEVEPVAEKQTVVNDTFAVNAGSYRYYKFNLATSSQVVGRVEASGGKNDIETIILDEDEFVNYKNTGRFSSYHRSGYVTIDNINVNLPAGSYYVIFSNSAALLTNKVVKAKVEIQ